MTGLVLRMDWGSGSLVQCIARAPRMEREPLSVKLRFESGYTYSRKVYPYQDTHRYQLGITLWLPGGNRYFIPGTTSLDAYANEKPAQITITFEDGGCWNRRFDP